MIRKDFYDGNTHIRIDDECCVGTEEVDEILVEIARIAIGDMNSSAEREMAADQK
jgi:hypothetical protein